MSHPWRGNEADGELVTHRHEVDREHTLHLYAVMPADAGAYVCTAQSQLGTAAATTFLHIREGQCATSVASTITRPSRGSCKGIHLTGSI